MVLRYSTEKDKDSIDALIKLCFGDRPVALTDIEGRYLLGIGKETGKIVGITGICESDYSYYGLEVDWTCVHPDYRKRGVITYLLEQVIIDKSKTYSGNLYYSAWGTCDVPVRMDSILTKLGFEQVVPYEFSWNSKHNCDYHNKEGCVHWSKSGCNCWQHLWVLNIDKFKEERFK